MSEVVGYTERGTGRVRVPTENQVRAVLTMRGLSLTPFFGPREPTASGHLLLAYFQYRADLLTQHVERRLMSSEQAGQLFARLRDTYQPTCPLPMNKQKGEKKTHSFLTSAVNILVEATVGAATPCNYDPRELVTITHEGQLQFTMSRRMDGAFPSTRDPIAVWENKEYYYTTTFGSRVADGVYETQLDGYELIEASRLARHDIEHVLFIDAYLTWWEMGRSYLCRIVDMLNMGLVDEIVVGSEVEEAVPRLATNWLKRYNEPGV